MRAKFSPLVAMLGSSSLFCKCLYAVLALGHLISYSETLFYGLSITPRNLLPPNFWIWTVATYFLVEKNVICVLADLASVHLCGAVLEPAWTGIDLAKYMAIVNASVGLAGTLFLLLSYFMVRDLDLIFSINIHGLSGFVGALLVAVKQLLPDSTIVRTPAGRVKNTHLPIIALSGATVLAIIGALNWAVIMMYSIGAYTGWIYLRYYQPHSNGSKGDPSDHFAFPTLFPSWMNGPVEILSTGAYRILIRLGVCTPAIRSLDMESLSSVSISTLPAGMESQDADRRRQKALKDLSARLSKASEAAWPSLVEDRPSLQPHSPPAPSVSEPAPASPEPLPSPDPIPSTQSPLLQLQTPPGDESN